MDIPKDDIEEKFIRSRGKGGQNVNKVATCVQLKHLPSGIIVKCDKYRYQSRNRNLAMALLVLKLEEIKNEKIMNAIKEIEKELRKNRKKPAALKEKILKEKKQISDKKNFRKKVSLVNLD